jgi:glycosyltransferase involved in cell wall biosynthesis
MSKRSMSVSLIITTYNWEDALEEVLLSAFLQKVSPDEIIIADDGSKDTTGNLIDKLKEQSEVPVIHSWQEDLGFRAAMSRNKAIAKASSEYIITIDGDMMLHPLFIKDHLKHSQKNQFTIGSRVLLSENKTNNIFQQKNKKLSFFSRGIKNRKNTIHSNILSKVFSIKTTSLKGIRTCNMGFFKEDAISVNGFNEDFTGWGREDSEFAVRLFNHGLIRKNIKFNAIGYHLFHKENTRKNLEKNDEILAKTISEKLNRCPNGIDKYL